MARNVQRQKTTLRKDLAAPQSIDFDIPLEISTLADGSSIILYDSHADEDSNLASQQDRLILLGTKETLDQLESSDDYAVDGTFAKAPQHFLQLYSIHFRDGQSFRPAAIALMTRKSLLMYNLMLEKLMEWIPNAKPARVFIDYEQAAISAFKRQFKGKQVRFFINDVILFRY